MNEQEFMKSVSVQTWLGGLKSNTGMHSTQYHWANNLKRFCEYVKKTPDQLIEERKLELKGEDQRERHKSEQQLKAFLSILEQQGKSPNTRKNYFASVRNFYKRNYYELTFFRGDGPLNETVTEGCRAAGKNDLRAMIEVSNPRVRALLLFLKDTGLAEADTAKLKLKDISKVENGGVQGLKDVSEIFLLEPPVPLIVKRQKTKRLTITFLGKESLDALRTTLKLRQQGSAELTIRRYNRNENKLGMAPETLTLDSPLFRSYEKFFARKDMKIKHLSPSAISVIVRRSAINAGCWKDGFSAHALRRYYQTSLETAGVASNWIKKMMGHTLGNVESSYSRPEIVTLREAYSKAYSHLAVTENAEQTSRVQQLEAQVAALTMNGHSKTSEIDDLHREISDMKKTLDDQIRKLVENPEFLMKAIKVADTLRKANEKGV